MKLSGLATIAKDKLIGEDVVPEQMFEEGDGALDLAVAEKMLKWHAEAVGRMVELSALGDVLSLFFLLLLVTRLALLEDGN